jgi:hypothetical protein
MKDYRRILIITLKLVFYLIVLPIVLCLIFGEFFLRYFDLM